MIVVAKYLGRPEPDPDKPGEIPPEQATVYHHDKAGVFVVCGGKPVDVANDSNAPVPLGAFVMLAPNPEYESDPKQPPWRIIATSRCSDGPQPMTM